VQLSGVYADPHATFYSTKGSSGAWGRWVGGAGARRGGLLRVGALLAGLIRSERSRAGLSVAVLLAVLFFTASVM
jgi:hypothetical protein